MLNTMRKYAAGWVAQIFIGLLVVSFAVWGIADIFRGMGGNSVARVGDTEISGVQFDRAYRRELQSLSRRLGQQVTPDQARLLGLPNQVLGQLITEAALDDEAHNLSLGVSRDMLAREISADPAFKGAGGTFDRNYFAQLLQSNGLTEDEYVMQRRALEKRRQIADSIASGPSVPQTLVNALEAYRNEKRDIRYIVLPASIVGDVGTPNNDELTAYFNDNKANWKAPELRALTLLKVEPADIAKPADVSDADAQKHYDENKAAYSTPEQRHVFQVLFTDKSAAEEAAGKIKDGATFQSIVEGMGQKLADVDLGVVTRDRLIDPKVAEAAFALPANGTSGVVEGSFGPVIVSVGDVTPATVQPFDAVKDAIKKDIATANAKADVGVLHDAIEDARAGGATLEEIAKNNKLATRAIPDVDNTGKDAAGNAVADIPVEKDLLKAAFESDIGIDNASIPTAEGGYVWFTVTDIKPARDRTLDEVKDKVIAAWKAQTTDDRLATKAKEAQERLGKGETLDAVATSLSLPVESADGQTRGSKPEGDFSAEALRAAFGGPKGWSAVAPGAKEDTQIVLQVANVVEPATGANSAETDAISKQLAEAMQNDLLDQYLNELRNTLGATVNQTVLQRIIGTQS